MLVQQTTPLVHPSALHLGNQFSLAGYPWFDPSFPYSPSIRFPNSNQSERIRQKVSSPLVPPFHLPVHFRLYPIGLFRLDPILEHLHVHDRPWVGLKKSKWAMRTFLRVRTSAFVPLQDAPRLNIQAFVALRRGMALVQDWDLEELRASMYPRNNRHCL